jgi:hypothetical protein
MQQDLQDESCNPVHRQINPPVLINEDFETGFQDATGYRMNHVILFIVKLTHRF